MTFKYPLVLLLLLPLALLFWRSLRSDRSGKVLRMALSQRGLSVPTRKRKSFWLPLLLRSLALFFCVVALARPQTSSSTVRRSAEGIDIVLAVDVSQSMLIEDVGIEDRNRLHVARDTVHKFVQGRRDDRLGLLMFSGEAVTLCPPTLDYEVLLQSLENLETGVLRDGTAIGDAIATATARLRDSKAKSRVIILITDGDNNMGSIAPLTAGDVAAGYGIKVYAIALGTEGLVRMPTGPSVLGFKAYQTTQSTINPTLLKKIADDTGGRFFRANDDQSLQRVFQEINKLETTVIETKDRVLWSEHFQILLFWSLVFFLAELVLRSTLFRILPE